MMGFPKRDALFDEIVGEFGGEHGGFEGFCHVGLVGGEGAEDAGEDLGGGGEEVDGGEDGGGAFLHVFVVAGGEGVEGGGEAGEEAVHLAGFAAEEFEGVGVLGGVRGKCWEVRYEGRVMRRVGDGRL